jgi:hypothetical protein
MSDTIICSLCQQPKAVSEFYTRSGMPHLRYAWCIDCHKLKAKQQKKMPRHLSSVESETKLIEYLWCCGIPALPGKAIGHEYADVVAWGCVMIEVKSARPIDGTYHFNFTPLQQAKGLRGHVLVLATASDNDFSPAPPISS